MESKIQSLSAWLNENMIACENRRVSFEEKGIADGARLSKARRNAFEVFRDILNVANEQFSGEEGMVFDFFEKKLAQLSAAWMNACDQVEQQGNLEKARKEMVKLVVADEVCQKFWQMVN